MKNLTWALIVLFTTGFALGCGGSDDDDTTAATGTETAEENTEAAEESGDEAAAEAGPCDFATPEGASEDGEPGFTWTAATLGEGSGELCPDGPSVLELLNNSDESEDESEEETEEDGDCVPVQDTSADVCTFSLSCDAVTAEYTVSEDGTVDAAFIVSIDLEDGSAPTECSYTVAGELTVSE